MSAPTLDREAWLTLAADFLLDFPLKDCARPPYRVSVGWPRGRRGPRKAGSTSPLGACYQRALSASGHNEIFVAPIIDDAKEALYVLGRFLGEAINDTMPHVNVWLTMSPIEKETAIQDCIDALGPYPHARLDDSKQDKQVTRMLKVQCSACGWTCRASAKHIDRLPKPAACPCCTAPTLTHRG